MTVPEQRQASPLEAAVVRIDLRAAATGPDATDAGSIDEGTLESLQRRGPGNDGPGGGQPAGHGTGGWRIVDVERVLVVDDAAEFAQHADAYQYLVEAPTFGRMLCLVVGLPAEPPFFDVPQAVDSARAPVLWVGDPHGVGWRIGRSGTTWLAFNEADPEGVMTLAELVEALSCREVFDRMADVISDLSPDRTAVPALLPWVQWPAGGWTGDDKHEIVTTETPGTRDTEPPGPAARRRVTLLALGCAVMAVAAALAVPLDRLAVGYLAADAAFGVAGLLILLVIAFRRKRASPAPAGKAGVQVSSVPMEPAQPNHTAAKAPAPGQVPAEILDHARWIMSATSADESFRQLSSSDQLVMLGGEPHLAMLVKFAPAAARQVIESAADGDVVAWTTVSDRVGVIRLVPIKAGLRRLG